jgi:hypothetical protein
MKNKSLVSLVLFALGLAAFVSVAISMSSLAAMNN